MPVKAVPRIRKKQLERLTAELDPTDTPLVIEGAVSTWPAAQRWTRSHLEALIGGVSTQFKRSSCHQHPDFRQRELARMFARERATFSEFFAAILEGPEAERSARLFTGDEHFLMRRREGVTQLDPALAPLLADVDFERLVPQERLFTAWLWFSGHGVRTWLHYDNNGCHNFNAQLGGKKRCMLFAPDELRHMAPFQLGSGNPASNCSALDVELPAAQGGPDLERLTVWEATIEHGDLLFIPAWWWHSFEHLGELNVNMNVWWRPSAPRANATAQRQAWLDAVSRAGVTVAAAGPEAELLRKIDAELTNASAA